MPFNNSYSYSYIAALIRDWQQSNYRENLIHIFYPSSVFMGSYTKKQARDTPVADLKMVKRIIDTFGYNDMYVISMCLQLLRTNLDIGYKPRRQKAHFLIIKLIKQWHRLSQLQKLNKNEVKVWESIMYGLLHTLNTWVIYDPLPQNIETLKDKAVLTLVIQSLGSNCQSDLCWDTALGFLANIEKSWKHIPQKSRLAISQVLDKIDPSYREGDVKLLLQKWSDFNHLSR